MLSVIVIDIVWYYPYLRYCYSRFAPFQLSIPFFGQLFLGVPAFEFLCILGVVFFLYYPVLILWGLGILDRGSRF